MIKKHQTIAISTGVFTNKLLVDSAEFSYTENTKEYKGLCSPKTNKIKLLESTSFKLQATTSNTLSEVYTSAIGKVIPSVSTAVTSRVLNTMVVTNPSGIAIGSILKVSAGIAEAIVYVTEVTGTLVAVTPTLTFTPILATGLNTYTTSLDNLSLLKILEEFPEQAYEHLNMSCNTLELNYIVDGLANTIATFTGNTKEAIPLNSIPETTIDVVSYPVKKCKIRAQGYSNSITNLSISIVNIYKEFSCMSSSDFSKLLVDKIITGTMILEGSVKSMPLGYLIATVDSSHGIYIPEIIITNLREYSKDGIIYTEGTFEVTDNIMSVFFQ